MNKGSRIYALIFVLGAICRTGSGYAGESAVQFPDGYGAWTVEITKHATQKPATTGATAHNPEFPAATPPQQQPEIMKMEVTRTDNFLRSVQSWSDGKRTETWYIKSPQWALMDNPFGSGKVYLTASPELLPFPRPDEAMFSWVNNGTYDSNGPYNGKMCMIYRKTMPLANSLPKAVTGVDPPLLPHVAWIDEKTGLPVALDNGESHFAFTFQPPPKIALTLPERFQDEIVRAQATISNPKYLGKPRSWAKP